MTLRSVACEFFWLFYMTFAEKENFSSKNVRNIIDLTETSWEISNENFAQNFTAKIPVDIYMALFEKGLIPDPYADFNDVDWRNISLIKWNFSKKFQVPENFTEYLLIADSVDTISSIHLNGRKIGDTQNMFRRYFVDLGKFLNFQNSYQKLEFQFQPAPRSAQHASKWHVAKYNYSVPPDCPPDIQKGVCHVNMLRKMQSSFSWDWGPAFPTVGLYGNMQIRAFNICTLVGFGVVPVFDENTKHWRLNAEFLTFCQKNVHFSAKFLVKINGLEDYGFEFETNLWQKEAGQYVRSRGIKSVPDSVVQRWHPNGYGLQKLYDVIGILTVDGQFLSKYKSRLAFRHVKLIQQPIENFSDGLSFLFEINGVKTFLKGSNWIPADSFQSRVTVDKLKFYFDSMKAAHMNAIRVWGGGVYETDTFYDLADKYGIMIWHDMMFAVNLYPGNTIFLENIKQEIIHQIDRLKHHPCIIVWAGNNENELGLAGGWFHGDAPIEIYLRDYKALYWDAIYGSINSTDYFSRPYLTSSPSNGARTAEPGGVAPQPNAPQYGDMHYYNYDMDLSTPKDYPHSRCVTEFGFQSFAAYNTLAKWIDPNHLFYFDRAVTHRQHHLGGHEEILEQIWTTFLLPKCCISQVCETRKNDEKNCYRQKIKEGKFFREIIFLNQMYQALAYKAQTEHYRRWMSQLDKNGQGMTFCALYWQLNDIWPGISWSSVDYDGVWKPLHYYAKNFFSPLLLSPYIEDEKLSIFVVSDLQYNLINVSLIIDLHVMQNFEPIYTKEVAIKSIDNLRSTKVFDSPYSEFLRVKNQEELYIFFHTYLLDSGGQKLADNVLFVPQALRTYPYTVYGTVEVVNVTSSRISGKKSIFEMILRATNPAPFVWLEAKNIAGWFSDNGFLAWSHLTKIQFHPWNDDVTLDHFKLQLSITSLATVLEAMNESI